MAGVFREVAIAWRGTDYHVTPSNKLLRRIEAQGVSIAAMLADFASHRPVWSSFALVAAELLQAGGAKVTEDEIYEEIIMAETEDDQAALIGFATGILEAVSPGRPDPKKPGAP